MGELALLMLLLLMGAIFLLVAAVAVRMVLGIFARDTPLSVMRRRDEALFYNAKAADAALFKWHTYLNR